MKLIPLTKNYSALVDDADYDWLSKHKWHTSLGGGRENKPYAYRKLKIRPGKYTHESMSRLILGLKYGDPRIGDHKNGNTLDYRRENLQITTRRGNCQNRTCHRQGKILGVQFIKRWNIWKMSVGGFKTAEQAHEAYNLVVRTFFP